MHVARTYFFAFLWMIEFFFFIKQAVILNIYRFTKLLNRFNALVMLTQMSGFISYISDVFLASLNCEI